jgi:hypothetical protein
LLLGNFHVTIELHNHATSPIASENFIEILKEEGDKDQH